MEAVQDHWITRHIKEIVIGLVISTLISVVVGLFNLYIANRLYPLDETDRLLKRDVQALFAGENERKVDHDKILKIEEKIEGIEKGIGDIKSDTRDIKNYLFK